MAQVVCSCGEVIELTLAMLQEGYQGGRTVSIVCPVCGLTDQVELTYAGDDAVSEVTQPAPLKNFDGVKPWPRVGD